MSFSFQKNVGLYNKPAISGDRANQNPTIYEVTNFLAGSGGVNMGGFAWRSPSYPESQVVASASSLIPADGFVERTLNINGFTYDPASVTISEGENVTVARKGDFYVEADGAVSIGDTVYADTTDGSVTFTSGASTVDSGFKAKTAASGAGDMVIISNW